MPAEDSVYVVQTQRWMYQQLVDVAAPGSCNLAPSPEEATIVLYPVPSWADPGAPQRLGDVPLACAGRLFLFSEADHPLLWAPGVFASARADRNRLGAFRGGFYLPEHHDRRYEADDGLPRFLVPSPVDDPPYLWSFIGTVSTAPELRGAILGLNDHRALARDTQRWTEVVRWNRQGAHREEAADAFRSYAKSIAGSKFVVCPQGQGLSSIRLFEAMQMGRCPVIASDRWLPPPFINWSACSVRIAEREITRLPAILREREPDAPALGAEARRVWEEHFAPQQRLATLVRMCRDIDSSLGPRRLLRRAQVAADAATSYEALWRTGNGIRKRAAGFSSMTWRRGAAAAAVRP